MKKEKFKVGDIVKVNDDYEDVEKLRNEIGTIIFIDKSGDCRYGVEFKFSFSEGHSCNRHGKDGKCRYFSEDEITLSDDKISDEDVKSLAKSIDKLAKEIKKEDPFKQAMIEAIIDKGKDLATEDLKKSLKEDLDKYIKETYGMIPKVIEIKTETKKKEMKGIFHENFEMICKLVGADIPIMLVGGAGAGKSHTLEQVAEALSLKFYSTNAITQDYKLTGFIDANGVYHETEFYKSYKNGGLFLVDEIDASCPESLITLNTAISNKYFDFPTGRIKAHKDFRIVCAGNTYGTGADMIYVGRNVLDGASLDRFIQVPFDYDENVERQLAYDEDLFKFIRDLRQAVNKAGLRYIVSMRALINSSKMLELGIDKNSILRTVIVKNMQRDDLNTIIEKLEIKNGEWYESLKRMCD